MEVVLQGDRLYKGALGCNTLLALSVPLGSDCDHMPVLCPPALILGS